MGPQRIIWTLAIRVPLWTKSRAVAKVGRIVDYVLIQIRGMTIMTSRRAFIKGLSVLPS